MSRTPAKVTQADIARTIRAAQQCGARVVEVKFGDTTVTVRLDDADTPLVPAKEIRL